VASMHTADHRCSPHCTTLTLTGHESLRGPCRVCSVFFAPRSWAASQSRHPSGGNDDVGAWAAESWPQPALPASDVFDPVRARSFSQIVFFYFPRTHPSRRSAHKFSQEDCEFHGRCRSQRSWRRCAHHQDRDRRRVTLEADVAARTVHLGASRRPELLIPR
jgi:hypothetical protein